MFAQSQNNDEKKLDWMYKVGSKFHRNKHFVAQFSLQNPTNLVDREDYLLGRPVDKTLELLNAEEKQKQSSTSLPQPKNHVEHECIPPSIRDFKLQQIVAEQVQFNSCFHLNISFIDVFLLGRPICETTRGSGCSH